MRRGEGHRKEKGQTLVFVSLALAVVLGIVGLGLDGGQLYAARQRAQTIADAVAQAAVMDVYRGTNTGTNAFGSARITCPISGGVSPCSYAQQNGLSASDSLTIDFAASSPALDTDPAGNCTVTGVTLSSGDSPNLVCATVRHTVNTTLLRALGLGTLSSTVTARAMAAIV